MLRRRRAHELEGKPGQLVRIPVNDLDRAKTFYEPVIGTNLDVFEMGGVWMAWFPRPGNAVRSSGGLIQAPGRVSPRVAQRQI